jgi:hypothetical protein
MVREVDPDIGEMLYRKSDELAVLGKLPQASTRTSQGTITAFLVIALWPGNSHLKMW